MDAVHRGGTRSLPGATPRSGTRCPIDSCPRSGRPGGVHPNPGSRRRENIPRTGAPAQGHVKVKATVQVAQRPPGCGVERAIAPELPGRSSPGSPVDVKVEVKGSTREGFPGERAFRGAEGVGIFPGEAIPETGHRRAAEGFSRWMRSIAGELEAFRVQLREAGQGARSTPVPGQGGPGECTRTLDRAGGKTSPGPEPRYRGL